MWEVFSKEQADGRQRLFLWSRAPTPPNAIPQNAPHALCTEKTGSADTLSNSAVMPLFRDSTLTERALTHPPPNPKYRPPKDGLCGLLACPTTGQAWRLYQQTSERGLREPKPSGHARSEEGLNKGGRAARPRPKRGEMKGGEEWKARGIYDESQSHLSPITP